MKKKSTKTACKCAPKKKKATKKKAVKKRGLRGGWGDESPHRGLCRDRANDFEEGCRERCYDLRVDRYKKCIAAEGK
mgnify:CR=1 FL=1|jgi:hypothetical protein